MIFYVYWALEHINDFIMKRLLILTAVAAMVATSCGTSYKSSGIGNPGDEELNIGYGKTTKDDNNSAVSTLKMPKHTSYSNIYQYIEEARPTALKATLWSWWTVWKSKMSADWIPMW